MSDLHDKFRFVSNKVASFTGSVWSFILSLLIIIGWACCGPFFGYSDTWQLVINTSTTIVTFLMVFIIQNTQNRDSKAIHLKLDELIIAMKNARNDFVNIESLSDSELKKLEKTIKEVSSAQAVPSHRRRRRKMKAKVASE